jgi:acyl-CoA synthetase (AMP-forming)/AMP-acid ligase II
MDLSMLLAMAVAGAPADSAVTDGTHKLTYAELDRMAAGGARVVADHHADAVVYLGVNSVAMPVALFAAALAGTAFVPLNYRQPAERIGQLTARFARPVVVTDDPRSLPAGALALSPGEWLASSGSTAELRVEADPDSIAVLLHTSGTTAEPKAAILRHRHLVSYVLGAVDFGSAGTDEANLVSVPPYHIAAVANLLTNLYARRRVVYLPAFSAQAWLDLADAEAVTHSMVVPTMLARITDHLRASGRAAPALRTISYGGARMPHGVLEPAMEMFGDTGFVNAYGLTETSSTITVLGPDDHRAAVQSADPEVRARLGSVGRPVPGVTIGVFGEGGRKCPAGVPGELWVRGPQVAGEYVGSGSRLDAQGWFHTNDLAYVDAGGYLFVEGRMDDTIIRGGENIAPAEIEMVLLDHPAVADTAVVGVPDDEWGQRIVAVVVLRSGHSADAEELRQWVRERLRSAKTPDQVIFRIGLPRTETGKLVRRELQVENAALGVTSTSGGITCQNGPLRTR